MTGVDGLTVAMLETDAILCLSLEMSFEFWGIRLVRGGTAAALVQAVRRTGYRPDVLVADLAHGRDAALPAVVEELQAAFGRPVPVIVTTGNRIRKEAAALLERGWLLLEKPYAPDTLMAAVASLTGGSSGVANHR